MSKIVKKTLKNIEVITIIDALNRSITEGDVEKHPVLDIIKQCPTKVKWAFMVNSKALEQANNLYQEAAKELEGNYSDDEHSFEDVLKDDKGEVVKDTEGNETKIRSVKKEYIEKFQKEKFELFVQEHEIKINMVDIDDFGDVDLELEDLGALSFMINE